MSGVESRSWGLGDRGLGVRGLGGWFYGSVVRFSRLWPNWSTGLVYIHNKLICLISRLSVSEAYQLAEYHISQHIIKHVSQGCIVT